MINIDKITSGSMNGKIVWISDLRYNDYSNKPIRNVKPTKVMVNCNSNTKKNIYYSKSHFIGLNKKMEAVKSKVYPVFDSTGHKWRTGDPLNCFETERECIESYSEQVIEAIKGLEEHKASIVSVINSRIKELNGII